MIQLQQKILLVDNDQETLEPLRFQLERDGFGVNLVKTGEEAIEFAPREVPDAIILDIVLPGLDGVEVCRSLREMPTLDNTLIIFQTKRDEDYSQIAAFEAGADDYTVKPIRPRVFLTRLKALLKRRKHAESQIKRSRIGLAIDAEKMITNKNGKIIHWQNKEFELLHLLSSQPGKVFSRKDIYQTIWESDGTVNERTIDVYIRRIREKIGTEHIVTVFGRGYKFVK